MDGLPLADVRVLAVEQYGAGPFGSLHLADMGADVVKIEDPRTGGDVGRHTPPYAADGDSLFFQSFNRNKRSVRLDLSTGAGREVFEALVRVSDGVYSNLRGDVPERMRLTYRHLAAVNPRVVCCALSGYGMSGGRSTRPAYDYMMQGLAGWMSVTGDPDGPPTRAGLSLVDYCGGLVAALSMVAGIHAARRTGRGADCDLSLYDTAISMLTYLAAWQLNAGFEPVRTRDSAHPSLVPFQSFATADSWIVVACAKEKFWQRLVTALGHGGWAQDARFATFADRREHAAELKDLLGREFRQKTTREWVELLESYGVPCGRVNTVAEALAAEQTAQRGMVVGTEHPTWGTVRQVATAARVGAPRSRHQRAPLLGEHTRDVVTGLCGYDEGEYARLAAAGAFGPEGW